MYTSFGSGLQPYHADLRTGKASFYDPFYSVLSEGDITLTILIFDIISNGLKMFSVTDKLNDYLISVHLFVSKNLTYKLELNCHTTAITTG